MKNKSARSINTKLFLGRRPFARGEGKKRLYIYEVRGGRRNSSSRHIVREGASQPAGTLFLPCGFSRDGELLLCCPLACAHTWASHLGSSGII